MQPVRIFTKILDSHGWKLPAYETASAAGMDLRAAIEGDEAQVIAPGDILIVPTGIALGIPEGFEAQVRPRSGLAAKHGVTVLNSPGTIDADYRGEIKVILINHGRKPYEIRRGDRIAQMVFASVVRADLVVVDQLTSSERGDGGFGSTGIK